jgi:hypothetical protein
MDNSYVVIITVITRPCYSYYYVYSEVSIQNWSIYLFYGLPVVLLPFSVYR